MKREVEFYFQNETVPIGFSIDGHINIPKIDEHVCLWINKRQYTGTVKDVRHTFETNANIQRTVVLIGEFRE